MFNDNLIAKLFSGLSILILIIVVSRLGYLQIFEGDRYRSLVNAQSNARLTVTKNRGNIYDCNGKILATNKTVASLYAFRRNIDDHAQFINALNKNGIKLSPKAKLSLKSSDNFTWIARKLDIETASELKRKINGLEYYKEEARFYPEGNLMANILGFTGVDNQGRAGLEYHLDKILSGKKLSVTSIRDSRGKLILFDDKSDFSQTDTDVYLTINSKIQSISEHILRKGASKFGAKDGSVIAMDIKSGEIILAANVSSFDPHNYEKYSSNLWRNQPFTYVFEPGSIFKAVTFSFLAENNKMDREKLIDTSSKVTISGFTYNDTKDFGSITSEEAFILSSNIGVAKIMRAESGKDYHSFLKKAGFGSKTGVLGLTEEDGVLKDVKGWSPTSKTSISIGYEVMVTPLQMVRFYAALANGGVMLTPKIISKIVKEGSVSRPEVSEERVMSAVTSEYMLNLLQRTVEKGTGKNAMTDITKVAGKTGTSSIYDSQLKKYSKQNYVASFAGVFPAVDPKVAMVVVFESPSSSIYGGSTAANVFREIAEYVATELQYFDKSLRVVNVIK